MQGASYVWQGKIRQREGLHWSPKKVRLHKKSVVSFMEIECVQRSAVGGRIVFYGQAFAMHGFRTFIVCSLELIYNLYNSLLALCFRVSVHSLFSCADDVTLDKHRVTGWLLSQSATKVLNCTSLNMKCWHNRMPHWTMNNISKTDVSKRGMFSNQDGGRTSNDYPEIRLRRVQDQPGRCFNIKYRLSWACQRIDPKP